MSTADCSKPKISLLCVEDDPDSREIIRVMISKRFPGIEILLAENGMVGLDKFREHMPQIVMTDIKMPVMDGVTMVGEINALCPETKVIIVAANCNADYLLNDKEIDHCVGKPLNYEILFAIIDKCIADISSKKPDPEILFRILIE